MKHNRLLTISMLVMFLLSSCAALPGAATPTGENPGAPVVNIPVPTPAPAVAAAERSLTEELNVPLKDISVISVESVDWPDSCLGAPAANEMCAQMVTPGFRITLSVAGKQYVFHTNQIGDEVRAMPTGQPTSQSPTAGQKAIQDLADKLNIQPGQIAVLKTEAVEWPDACLGVSQPGTMCAQVITPGFLIVLEANGKQYEYHTNQDGTQAVLATETGAPPSSVIEWVDQKDPCQKLALSQDQAWIEDCQGKVTASKDLQPVRQAELAILAAAWTPFNLAMDNNTVTYQGSGNSDATDTEQQSVYHWLQIVRNEVATGQNSAVAGLAISWHREGGIAGFCDDLTIYLTGFAYSTSCKGGQVSNQGRIHLTADQLQQVYSWVGTFQSLDFVQEDSATADAMRQHLVINGTGLRSPSLEDKQAMLDLAGQLQAQAAAQPSSADLETARATLTQYFSALKSANYPEVMNLYGGSYETLQTWNPDVDAQNRVELWKRGCTQNGLRCDLSLDKILQAEAIGTDTYLIEVSFKSSDGSLFQLGPCCGGDATQQPPKSEFDYTVQKVNGQFRVMELPVYVP